MGKVSCGVLCAALVLAALVAPQQTPAVRAQTAQSSPCSGTAGAAPMPGRYTGSWHSDADYHFAVFNTDLVLTITIDGTLDVTVSPDGQVSGTAKGTVDAPIHHDGIRDVSSGTGTISGIVQGTLTPTGSALTLVQPVIAMQWGTFIAGGYTVPRSITMPSYQLPVGTSACVSLGGTISEQNFPTQFIVADGASGLTQAAGTGTATGSWSLAHTESAVFADLSQQVDSFIANANAALGTGGAPVSPAALDSSVIAPLHVLLTAIAQSPDISRCLLERLDAWVATTVPAVRARVRALLPSSNPVQLRRASDLVRISQQLQAPCSVADDGTAATLRSDEGAALDHAVAARDWAAASLLAREEVLSGLPPAEVGARLAADLHTLLLASPAAIDRLEAARVAYAVGDDQDARLGTGTRTAAFTDHALVNARKHKKKKHAATPTPTRTPAPRRKPTVVPTATPTSTVTPTPVTLTAALRSGAVAMSVRAGGTPLTFSWQAVPGAASYVVFVSGTAPGSLSFSWAGSSTSVAYGSTLLPGAAGSETETWPVAGSPGITWSVLALDASGHIIGLALRVTA